jgi:hypothetical protein
MELLVADRLGTGVGGPVDEVEQAIVGLVV